MTSIVREPLSRHQQAQIAALGTRPAARGNVIDTNSGQFADDNQSISYDDAFEHARVLEDVRARLSKATTRNARARLKREIDRRNNVLTHPRKAYYAKQHAPILNRALARIGACDGCLDIGKLYQDMSDAGELNMRNAAGRTYQLGESAFRELLRSMLGIRGTRFRKGIKIRDKNGA